MRASGSSRASARAALDAVDSLQEIDRPPRFSSRSTASRISPSDQAATKVLIASRFSGAVAITENREFPPATSPSVAPESALR